MSISYPSKTKSRGLPKSKSIQRLFEALCVSCPGLILDQICFSIMKFDRRNQPCEFVKITSYTNDPFGVSMTVSCEGVTIHGLLFCDIGGALMSSQALFEQIESGIGGRTFSYAKFIDTQKKEISRVVDNIEQPPVTKAEAVSTGAQGFFEVKVNLELATTALLVDFSPSSPFTFKDFESILSKELGLKCSKGEMKTHLKFFLTNGLVEIVKSTKLPKCYTLTQKALDLVGIMVSPKSDKQPPCTSLLTRMTSYFELREQEYQRLFDELEKLESQGSDQSLVANLEDEYRTLSERVRALTEELLVIKNRQHEIEELTKKGSNYQDRVTLLRQALSDPRLVQCHKLYTELLRERFAS